MTDCAKHQCHKAGCDSEAAFETRLHLWCVSPQARVLINAPCTLKCCGAHRSAATEWMLDPQRKQMIADGLDSLGLPPPDFNSASVEFVPIERPPSLIEVRNRLVA